MRRGISRVFPQQGLVLLTAIKHADDGNLLDVGTESNYRTFL